MPVIPLKPVDRVDVLSVMDNSIDVLMGSTPVRAGSNDRVTRTRGRNFVPSTASRCWYRSKHQRPNTTKTNGKHFANNFS